MNCGHKVILKGEKGKHTLFELEQLLKHSSIDIACKLISIYGEDTPKVIVKHLPDSLQREMFIGQVRMVMKMKETNRWNSKRGRI